MMTATASATSPASRPLVVLGFVLSTLLTGVVTCSVGAMGAAYQADRAEKATKVDKFAEQALAFDGLVRRFVSDVRAGHVSPSTRADIRANLEAQRGALENVAALHDGREDADVASYMALLGKADEGIKQGTGPLDTRSFAQAAADIASERPRLLQRLHHHGLFFGLG